MAEDIQQTHPLYASDRDILDSLLGFEGQKVLQEMALSKDTPRELIKKHIAGKDQDAMLANNESFDTCKKNLL